MIFASLCAAAAGTLDEEFLAWIVVHSKSYATVEEKTAAFEVFVTNDAIIAATTRKVVKDSVETLSKSIFDIP